MRTEQLEYFLAIAKYGSISQAANHLFLGQPTLSAAINGLESELNAKLFQRTKEGMKLTEKGKQILPLAKNMIAQHKQIYHIANSELMCKTNIHIACTSDISNTVMIEVVERLKLLYAKVTCHVEEMLPAEVMQRVLKGDCTLGISAISPMYQDKYTKYAKDNNLSFSILYHDHIHLCCNADHNLAQRSEISFEEIIHLPMALLIGFIHKGLFNQPAVFRSFSDLRIFSGCESVKKSIQQYNTVSLLPKLAGYQDIYFNQGIIKTIPITDFSTDHLYYLVYNKNNDLDQAEKKIMEYIQEFFFNLS